MNHIRLLFLFVLAATFSVEAQPPYDSTKFMNNLVPTVNKLRVIAKNAALGPAAARGVLAPGSESFDGVTSTFEFRGKKRWAKHTWSTTIAGGEGKIFDLFRLADAARAEMNRSFPGTYRQYPNGEWLIDSTFTIQISTNQKNRDKVSLFANIYREVSQDPQKIADSLRFIFYNSLANAQGIEKEMSEAVSNFYVNLRNAKLPVEVVNAAYYTASKEKAANDTKLAYLLLNNFRYQVPENYIRKGLSPETAAAVHATMKKQYDADIAAITKKNNEREAAKQKEAQEASAAAAARAKATTKVATGPKNIMDRIVIYKTQPSKNYVVTTSGAMITGEPVYQKDLQVGDQVFTENNLKNVQSVFSDYVYFNDNTSVNRTDWTVYAIRGWRLKSNTGILNCKVCNNRPVTTTEAPVHVVTGYKTHTYNTSGRTTNVISTPTTTQVGSVGRTTYCTACNGKGGMNVNQTRVEVLN